MSAPKAGAIVAYCGHDACFPADIYLLNGVNIVQANGPIEKQLCRPCKDATHHLNDFPVGGFWKPHLGIFAVPADQVTELKEGEDPYANKRALLHVESKGKRKGKQKVGRTALSHR